MKKIVLLSIAILLSFSAFAQDIITKRDGKRINAIVTEITDRLVRYKYFSNPQMKPTFLYRDMVSSILYEDGTIDRFDEAGAIIADAAKDASPITAAPVSAPKPQEKPEIQQPKVERNSYQEPVVTTPVKQISEHRSLKGTKAIMPYFGSMFTFPDLEKIIGVEGRFHLSNKVRFAPSLDFYIEPKNWAAEKRTPYPQTGYTKDYFVVDLNVNFHYIINFSRRLEFYPLAGIAGRYGTWDWLLNRDNWEYSYFKTTLSDENIEWSDREAVGFKANLGAGFTYHLTDRLFADLRFTGTVYDIYVTESFISERYFKFYLGVGYRF